MANADNPYMPLSTPPPTILVLDDDAGMRRAVRRALRGQGYKVLEAADGPTALALLAGHPGRIALLITDVFMPGMTGLDVARCIEENGASPAILFMSGDTDGARALLADDGALRHFIGKPFTVEAFLAKVEEVLHGA